MALSMDDAIHLNNYTITTQIYINNKYKHQSIKNIIQLINTKIKIKIPTITITNINKNIIHNQHYFSLTTQITTKIKTQIIKTYYIKKNFKQIITKYPIPIIITNNKKLPKHKTLKIY